MTDALIIGLSSAVGGGAVTLVAPWVKWSIKKKELDRNDRKLFIAECRIMITQEPFDLDSFCQTAYYSKLRLQLSPETINTIEHNQNVVTKKRSGARRDNERLNLLDDISALEKKWKLI
jgi:hypothetical protein